MLLINVLFVSAQNSKEPNSLKFHSVNNIGLLQGQSGAAFQWQTVNGVQYNSWFAGIGAGIDYYKFRGVPVFIDVRKEFGSSGKKFFVYGDVGIHYNWVTSAQKENTDYAYGYDFHKGLYTDAGIGYSLQMARSSAFLISLGYSYKTVNQSRIDYTPVEYVGPPAITNNRYTMGRITLKLGLKL